MMNLGQYIKNGTVIDYYLGHLKEDDRLEFEITLELYPELKAELHALQKDMDEYLRNKAVPGPELREKIWETLQNMTLGQRMNLSHLPILDKHSDPDAWHKTVTPLIPEEVDGDFFAKVLTETPEVKQVLIKTRIDVPEEIHEDVLESFILLEGECECHIRDKIIDMKAGDYLEIPLNAYHNVKVLSEYVVAVMQRITVRA